MRRIEGISKQAVQQGFILADVAVAILIISLALVAISALVINAIQADVLASHYTVAANLVQKQLELLKTYPPEYWDSLTLPILWQDDTMLPWPIYQLTTNAVLFPNNAQLVEVTVTAYWQERGRSCKVQFVSLYPRL